MDVEVYRQLICYGMQVKVEDIAYAVKDVNIQPKLVDLLVDECKYEYSDRDAYDKVIETMEDKKSNSVSNKKQHRGDLRKQLITVLRKGTKVIYTNNSSDHKWL